MKENQGSRDEGLYIMIASDAEHEQVFAEIYHGEKFVALVSQEGDDGRSRVEFPGVGLRESLIERSVDLEQFSEALVAAVAKLKGG